MLAREKLERNTLVARIWNQYEALEESKSFPGKIFVGKEDRSKKLKYNRQPTLGDKSEVESKIICFYHERPGDGQYRCPLETIRPVCVGRGHTSDDCGAHNKSLILSDSKSMREDGEDMNVAVTMSAVDSPGDSVKADYISWKGMSETGLRVCDDTLSVWHCLLLPPPCSLVIMMLRV